MAQKDIVYNYLVNKYEKGTPIFLSDVDIPEMKAVSVRQQINKLVKSGQIKRFDTGIYYLPQESIFLSGSSLSVDEVIRRKYLLDKGESCGYVGGIVFANRIGLTTQVPGKYEIYTNKATTDLRETSMAGISIIIRRPYVKINENNVKALQFLDLLKEVSDISELIGRELRDRLLEYMKRSGIAFSTIEPYLRYYPDRIYKNMYEVGLLYGVSA